jgi:hypothetical protein
MSDPPLQGSRDEEHCGSKSKHGFFMLGEPNQLQHDRHQRRQYMATAFFREVMQLSLHEADLSEGLYATTGNAEDDASKLW